MDIEHTIYYIFCQTVGLYEPILNADGTYSIDWGYIGSCVIAVIGFWFLLKLLLGFLKVVMKIV